MSAMESILESVEWIVTPEHHALLREKLTALLGEPVGAVRVEPCAPRSWKVRAFGVHRDTGDPYTWCGVLEDRGDGVAEIGCTLEAPPIRALPLLWEEARKLGLSKVRVTRMKGGQPVVHEYRVPPA